MKKIVILLIVLHAKILFSQIAVLPYKQFSMDKALENTDYSALMATAVILTKDIPVLTTHEAQSSLRMLGVNSETSLTKENLRLIGIKNNLNYILTGSVSSTRRGYYSKSLLYSVQNNEIISRKTVFGKSLVELAEKEAKVSLTMVKDKKYARRKRHVDVLFLIDMSYNNRIHWDDIKRSIKGFSGNLFQRGLVSSRIYIVPYSARSSYENVLYSEDSIMKIDRGLDRMNPSGRGDAENFAKMLNYSMNSVKWRRDSLKRLFIINNTEVKKYFLAESISAIARRKNIKINTLTGFRDTGEGGVLKRLSEMTGGRNSEIVYRQVLYDREGKSHNGYMTGGRLFYSFSKYEAWRDMARKLKESKLYRKNFLPEEVFSTSRFTNPERIEEYIAKTNNITVINKSKIETSVVRTVESELGKLFGSGQDRAVAKALVTDGKINLWVKINNREVLNSFQRSMDKGFYISTAFNVLKNKGEAYGIELVPVNTSVPFSMVPDVIKLKIKDVIGRSKYYTTNGIGEIPTWFINVKVQEIRFTGRQGDVRN